MDSETTWSKESYSNYSKTIHKDTLVMKKFLIRIMLFGIVFVLNASFVFTVDAYNIFFESNFIEDEYKKLNLKRSDEAMPRGNALWKINKFSKNPSPDIIIGDSRAMGFDTDIVKEVTNKEFFNFAVPGGNFKTISDFFWFASENTKLENVVIQVGFSTYNKRNDHDLYNSVISYYNNPFRMFLKDWFVFDSYNTLKYKLSNEPTDIDKLDNLELQKKNFNNWDQVIQKQGYAVLRSYVYPENYYASLQNISEYCKENGINLKFVIFPSHPDYYKVVEDLGLSDERIRFLKDINEMGETIDFTSSQNPLITNNSSYIDLYHIKHSIIDTLTYEIWNRN